MMQSLSQPFLGFGAAEGSGRLSEGGGYEELMLMTFDSHGLAALHRDWSSP